ncbi:MAG: DEAD/DEAH box helicase, partial [Flavobacteriia bacterium]
MQNYLSNLKITQLNDMQEVFVKDSSSTNILLSNTGSGKTLAFLLKIISILKQEENIGTVLILSPTRELAQQIYSVIQQLRLPYSSLVCFGGHSFKNERLQFEQNPQIIVATPGRILDHYERGTQGLNQFDHLIIDEYDKTLALGFLTELSQIMTFSRPLQSIQLISATVIEELPKFFHEFTFKTHHFLTENKPEITFYRVTAQENDKLKALALLLIDFKNEPTLVFCTHREACERIAQHLKEYGKSTAVFHGGLEQDERQLALFKFKSGAVDCLICSDLASRGLDIPEIQHIVHYQFPHTLEDFTHRNGRTARMTKTGKVYLIHSEKEPLPEYCNTFELESYKLQLEFDDYLPTKWIALFINIGRKDKVRKVYIVGFLTQEL